MNKAWPAEPKLEEPIKDNKSFCLRPWMHLMLECNGDVKPCCVIETKNLNDRTPILGNANSSSLEEMWNSPFMLEMRRKMLLGEKIDYCKRCYIDEAKGAVSVRQHTNFSFRSKIKKAIIGTHEDGSYPELDIIYWDVRFSNKCNFKCRTCGPEASSAWVADRRKMVDNPEYIKGLTKHENVEGIKSLEYLKTNADKIERISFAGGEPLVMDEHYQLLEHLIANNNFCILTYHSNMSRLKYRDWDIIQLWKKWPIEKLWIFPSIDEIEKRAEVLRCGTVWSEVDANIREVLSLGTKYIPNITVSCMNVNRLPEILTYLYDIGLFKSEINGFTLGMVTWPAYMQISVLPDKFKEETKHKLLNFIPEFKEKTGRDISNQLAVVIGYLDKPNNPSLTKQFIDYSAKLDALRDENTFKTFPELECVKEVSISDGV